MTGATAAGAVQVLPVRGLPEVVEGDDLAALIAAAADLVDGDVVVIAQKVVSKAEGAWAAPLPGEDPRDARRRVGREQAAAVLADTPQALVVRTRHGLVCANAGVDASNVPGGRFTLLPADPDRSAARLRDGLRARLGVDVGVIVTDTFGRPWRSGQTEVAIGAAGVAVLRDERGGTDREGRVLDVTLVAVADELAAAADLVRGKADGVPVVVVRGVPRGAGPDSAAALVRSLDDDLFAHGRGWLARAVADPQGPWRQGPPTEEEWAQVLAAARHRGGGAVRVTRAGGGIAVDPPDGTAAGLALATAADALLDLGYPAQVRHGAVAVPT